MKTFYSSQWVEFIDSLAPSPCKEHVRHSHIWRQTKSISYHLRICVIKSSLDSANVP